MSIWKPGPAAVTLLNALVHLPSPKGSRSAAVKLVNVGCSADSCSGGASQLERVPGQSIDVDPTTMVLQSDGGNRGEVAAYWLGELQRLDQLQTEAGKRYFRWVRVYLVCWGCVYEGKKRGV